MKKIVVTGASGFIGGALSKRLLQANHTVYGVGLGFERRNDLTAYKNFIPIELEFSQYKTLHTHIPEPEIDIFYHFAWQGGFEQEKLRDYELQLTNAKYACIAIMEAVKIHTKRFVYAASINEIEIHQFLNHFASFQTRPTCIYATAKLAAELICRTIAQENKLHYNAGIIPMLYGEGNRSKQLINVVIDALLKNQRPKLIEGNNLYDLVSIEDVVEAFEKIGWQGKDGKRYYVGHQELKTFREWMRGVGRVINPNMELRFGEYQDPLNLDYSLMDLDELYRDTGFVCRTDFVESIQKTAAWLKNQTDR